jgi:hypothetical protein
VTACIVLALGLCAWGEELSVDFRFAPPQWQASICLPDDSHKTLVDRSGELLYHYRQGGREFGTRVSVSVVEDARWTGQELCSPRVPIMRTLREAPGLKIVEEAFALTELPEAPVSNSLRLSRLDGRLVNRNWARPAKSLDPSLAHIALHNAGSIRYRIHAEAGGAYHVALAFCEGWWDQAGQRVQVLRVEGAAPVTVDTVADLGKNQAGAFWFRAKDTDGDGGIDVQIDAADQAGDKNTILNGLWVFEAGRRADNEALLAGMGERRVHPSGGALARSGSWRRASPARGLACGMDGAADGHQARRRRYTLRAAHDGTNGL